MKNFDLFFYKPSYQLKMQKWIFFILPAMIGFGDLYGQEKKEAIGTWISRAMDSVITNYKVPGIAVGVVENGRVVFKQGIGFADLSTKKRITTQTIFHTASVTKTFVATYPPHQPHISYPI